ncbi:MAG: hypothetical protein QXO75_10415, partial [Nitrososphaerota archaeon]
GGASAYVLVNVTLLSPWTTFPYGSGTLATIRFKIVYQERVLKPDLTPPLTCDLGLLEVSGVFLVDDEGQGIPCNVEGGVYEVYPTHVCDVNGDYKVGVDDIVAAAMHFGTRPGRPRWDPKYDVNGDGKVGVDDIVQVASNFGWKAKYDP